MLKNTLLGEGAVGSLARQEAAAVAMRARCPNRLLIVAVALAATAFTGCEVYEEDPKAPHDESVGERSFALTSQTLEQYAAQCDAEIGYTVSDFNCDHGTLVPTTNYANHKCDRPNRLNQECDPGSRFQVLFDNTDAYAVAHCRKQDHAAGRYGDIAVIQHNRKNGATCFYQALGNLSGDVKAPSKGRSAYSDWETPAGTASIGCAGCHDNGPLIRSPYLTQLTGSNKLPGAGDTSFNRDQPYRFVGNDFASWQVLKVEVAGNLCNSCHRMGFNNVRTHQGTALDLGLRATATSEVAKNPHSTDSPIWMLPSSTYYSQTNEDAAKAIAACATAYRNNQTLPSGCKVTDYTTVGAGCVRLYDECDYGGEFYEACGDHAGLSGQGFNDKTSSLRLGADVERVVLYQHGNYTGSSVTVTEDESCLSRLNNETTSVDLTP